MPAIDNIPTAEEKRQLTNLLFYSVFNETEKEEMMLKINGCIDYKTFQLILYYLEENQVPLDQTINPTQQQINRHLKKFIF